MLKINNTIDTILNLLDEQKELLAPSQCEIINAATHYAFESDDSVCLKGPNGGVWVFKDGTYTGVSEEPGTNGYPAYINPTHLAKAKEIARKYFRL